MRWEEGVRINRHLTINEGERMREVVTEGSGGGAEGRAMMTDDGNRSNTSPLSGVVRVQS